MILERDDLSPGKLLLLIAGLTAAALLFFNFPALRSRYQAWKQGGTLAQAQKFAAANDLPNAQLAINNALRQDPGNAEVWKFAADLLEHTGNADAVRVRRRVVELDPAGVDARYDLVRTALLFQDILTAREAIEAIAPSEQTSPRYRRATAALAMASGLPDRADTILDGLVQTSPDDPVARLERYTIGLRHAPAARADQARRGLRELVARKETRVTALRELILDAGRRRDFDAALAHADQLLAEPDHVYVDRLLAANVRLAAGRATLAELLPPLQTEAAGRPEEIRHLIGWLLAIDEAGRALSWLDGLPLALRDSPEVLTARANCQVALHAWPEVASLIKRGAWGPVSDDAIQLALAARVLHGLDRLSLQRSLWDEALRASAANLNGLLVLHRLALSWNWRAEARAALLVVAERHPSQLWAHQSLAQQFHEAKDTTGLKTVFRLWNEAQPGNAYVEGNRIFLDLLTRGEAGSATLETAAARLRNQQPANPFFVTNHAFALWRLQRYPDALAELETLPQARLAEPGRALYHALVLASLGRAEDAEAAITRTTAQAGALLPEERLLLDEARALARAKPPEPEPEPTPESPAETTPNAIAPTP